MVTMRRKNRGFTIVELLVVIVVIGILAAITTISYSGIASRATVSALQSDLINASQQLRMFQVDNSKYPATISTDCVAKPDSTTNKCLKASTGVTYQYAVNNDSSFQTFSLLATKDSTKYRVTNDSIPTKFIPVIATGGNITDVDGLRIHTFTSNGNFTVTNGGNVEVLVVAGGGSGGGQGLNDGSGGGGAGGLIYNSAYPVTAGNLTVTVGNGGSGVALQILGNNGENSVFDTLVAIGGGGGGSEVSGVRSGKAGGSGGGAGGYSTLYVGGVGTVGQGNNGGANIMPITPNYGGGGGGGAGSVGIGGTIQADSISNHISGGNGLVYSISGTSVFYAGGGGNGGGYGGYGGLGGSSSGGKGGDSVTNQAAGSNGAVNTGGGGGGGGGQSLGGVGNSGSGGSGIVIIRYPL